MDKLRQCGALILFIKNRTNLKLLKREICKKETSKIIEIAATLQELAINLSDLEKSLPLTEAEKQFLQKEKRLLKKLVKRQLTPPEIRHTLLKDLKLTNKYIKLLEIGDCLVSELEC